MIKANEKHILTHAILFSLDVMFNSCTSYKRSSSSSLVRLTCSECESEVDNDPVIITHYVQDTEDTGP